MEYRQITLAEQHLTGGEIEFPHPTKPLVVKVAGDTAVPLKALVPVPHRLGVMYPQDLDVGRPQTGSLTAAIASDTEGI